MSDNKNTLHDLGSILAIVSYTLLLYYYFNIPGLIISISTIVVGFIILNKSEYVLKKIPKPSNVKRVFFYIIVLSIVLGAVSLYSYKVPDGQIVVAISPFYYTSESGEHSSDINTANDLREIIEDKKDLGIKVIILDNPIRDVEDAKSEGKEVGASLVIYGETKRYVENTGEIKYNILPLFEEMVPPLFENKNVDKNNLIFSGKAKYDLVANERITIVESIKENASSTIYAIAAFDKYIKSNFTSAIALFKNVKNYENESYILYYISNCYLLNNNLNESLQYIDKAIHKNPQLEEAWLNRGVILNDLGKYDEALAANDKAIDINPQYVPAWNNKGNILNNLGRHEEALTALDIAININPQLEEAWLNNGSALNNLGIYDEALTAYDKAININPQYELAWYGKGVTLNNLGRYDEALTAYDKAIDINPQYEPAWNNKGNILNDLGRYEEALTAFDIAININPQLEEAWNNKGVTLDNLGKYDEALTAYDKAIDINPLFEEARLNKGNILNNLGRHDEALAIYDNAIDINPQFAKIWYNKGNTLNKLGRYDEALTAYDKAIDINPQLVEPWNNKGNILNDLGRYDEALNAYDKAININPQFAKIWYNKGNTLNKLGRYEEAKKAFERANELNYKSNISSNQKTPPS